MGENIRLKSAAGEIGAYLATPKGSPKGGIVVIQEIFGCNHHIRAVTDKFAADGYLALAPCFFDHLKPGIELGYTPDTLADERSAPVERSHGSRLHAGYERLLRGALAHPRLGLLAVGLVLATGLGATRFVAVGFLPAMDEGAIVEQGPPAEIFGAPKHERTRAFLARYTHGH